MTFGCSESKRATRSQGFLFNPFEIAIAGGPDELRSAFAASVANVLKDRFLVHLNANLDAADPYEIPHAALESDIAILASSGDTACSSIRWIDNGATPAKADNVNAHWSAPEACPVISARDTFFTTAQVDEAAQFIEESLRARAAAVPIHGLVLAGGHSTRMGEDKAQLDYHGAPQFERTAALLGTVCDEVFISTRPDQADEAVYANAKTLPDSMIGYGPMGAIMGACVSNPNVAWLVCACDLPYLDVETLECLRTHRNPFRLATAFRSKHNEFPEPLCTIYEPKSIHRLAQFFALGYICPRKVLINSQTHILEAMENDALENVNTPDDHSAAMRRIQESEEVQS